MVAAYTAASSQLQEANQVTRIGEDNRRTPLAPSTEKNNGIPRGGTKNRSREVTSRYKITPTPSSSNISNGMPNPSSVGSSRRCPSPNVSRTQTPPDVSSLKRALSAERRRPSPSPRQPSPSPTPRHPSPLQHPSPLLAPRQSSPSPAPRQPSPSPSSRQPPDSPRLSNGNNGGSMDITSKRTVSRGGEGLWPSTRNLSVSMIREPMPSKSVNGNVDQTLKPTANIAPKAPDSSSTMQRKPTPERKRTPRRQNSTESENSKPLENPQSKPDQQRWPGRRLVGSAFTRSVDLTRSVDFSDRTSRVSSILTQAQSVRNFGGSRGFKRSINEPGPSARRASLDGKPRPPTPKKTDPRPPTPKKTERKIIEAEITFPKSDVIVNAQPEVVSDVLHSPSDTISDTDSVSSSSNSASQEPKGSRRSTSASRGTTVPARFLHENNNRLHRLSGLRSSMQESSDSLSILTRPSSVRLKALSTSINGLPLNGTDRALASPRISNRFTGTQHTVSPGKLPVTSSPSRGLQSPTRSRTHSSLPVGNSLQPKPQSASSVISFADVRKGRRSLSQVEEVHHLRILHNRLLQWRFINARAEAAMHAQKISAEKLLYNVWFTTSELRDSVTMRRINLHQMRQEDKLDSILRGQILHLEEWSHLEREHSSSLAGAIESLESATLRLPVTSGARADIQQVKEAVSSAVDVMQAMGSAICSLLPKVEGMNTLVTELADVTAQERVMLGECVDFLATAEAMEVEESSLRAHLIQLKQGNFQQPFSCFDNNVITVDSGQWQFM